MSFTVSRPRRTDPATSMPSTPPCALKMSTTCAAWRTGRARTPLHAFLLNAWYFDRFYDHVIVRPYFALCAFFARFDLGVIDGAVNLTGRIVVWWSTGTRRIQTGYVVNYALTMAAGAVALVGFLLAR